MKLVVERKALLEAVERVARVVKADHHPILKTVVLEVGGDRLSVMGTDTDVEAHVLCDCEIETSGDAALPADGLLKLLKRLADGPVTLEIVDDGRIRVKARGSQVHFPILKADDMPRLELDSDAPSFEMVGRDLAVLLSVVFAASDNISRPYLCGVYLHVDEQRAKLCSAATDAHIMARVRVPLNGASFEPAIVGARAAAEVARLARLAGSDLVRVTISSRIFTASWGDICVVSKLVEGTYPNYERVFPTGDVGSIQVGSSEITDALHRALIVAADRSTGIRCQTIDEQMSISVTGNGAEALETVDVAFDGTHDVRFSAKLAVKVIEALDSDVVTMSAGDPGSPIVWRGSDERLTCLLMPMRG